MARPRRTRRCPEFRWRPRNVIRLRTFSKAYGLAGLRVGYGLADAETSKAFDKVRNHFGLNRLAQVAGIAALADHAT